jgi:feruloyl esterase
MRMKFRKTITSLSALVVAGCAAFDRSESKGERQAVAPPAPMACESLSALRLKDARVVSTEEIPGDKSWPFPKSPFNIFLGPNAVATTPFCRVVGVIEDEIEFEVWLPPNWNGRLQSVGNGGMTGAVNYGAMQTAVAAGYAAAGTDTGHKTPDRFFDVSWIKDHRRRVENFGRRAHHLLAATAKEVVKARYGEAAKYAYYNGCSSGGWQGLTEAQQYPDDYDGIIAGAPANNFVRLQTRKFHTDNLLRQSGGAELTEDEIKTLTEAAYRRCDGADGVSDGIMSDPERCDFDPASIECGKTRALKCLGKEQVARARLLIGPLKSAGGLQLYPGNAYGATPVLASVGGETPEVALLEIVPASRRAWTPETFDPDRDIPPLEKELGPSLAAWQTDLTAFRASGGKLIVYHGWVDAVLSPYNSIQYWEETAANMGGADNLSSFYRLFMAPGVDHCAGGPGPDRFDTLSALVDWVEKRVAPERIVASGKTADGAPRTRPLCPHPQVAVYDGKGDSDKAESFVCARPDNKKETGAWP